MYKHITNTSGNGPGEVDQDRDAVHLFSVPKQHSAKQALGTQAVGSENIQDVGKLKKALSGASGGDNSNKQEGGRSKVILPHCIAILRTII